ncbi:MAG: alcohol dehydrogenase catalytic domain-containing protein [Clostridia bacterium]|nr:alcohol dehydrogenase catalytic domain-containing protein [Clostridia bacterium]
MWALKLYGPNDIRLLEAPAPEISRNEILLKVSAAAVCGTDLRMWQNGYDGVDEDHPLTLGHEFAGAVAETGRDVPFYREGMQVALAPNIGCGICDRCVAGNPHLCGQYKAFGINMDGGFAEYAVIPEKAIRQGNLMVLPEGVTPAEAALNEPLSCAYNGFLKCGVKPGDYAMVAGAGPIGLLHAMLLKMAGAAKIMINDVSAARLAGAQAIIEGVSVYCGDDLAGFVREQTGGRGLDVAIAACPDPSVQSAMLPLMNYGGRVNFFGGVPSNRQPVPIDTNLVHYRELTVTGSTRSSTAMFRKTLEFVAAGLLPVSRLITGEYPIGGAAAAFENAKEAKGFKNVILF